MDEVVGNAVGVVEGEVIGVVVSNVGPTDGPGFVVTRVGWSPKVPSFPGREMMQAAGG